jgi:LysM repeat protein
MGRRWPASVWGPLVGALLLVACGSRAATSTRPRDTPLPPLPTVTTTTIPTTTLPAFYDVQRGDTLQGISEKLGVPIAALVAANNLANPDRIEAGQRLIVPRAPPEPATTATTVPGAPPASP